MLNYSMYHKYSQDDLYKYSWAFNLNTVLCKHNIYAFIELIVNKYDYLTLIVLFQSLLSVLGFNELWSLNCETTEVVNSRPSSTSFKTSAFKTYANMPDSSREE